MRQAVACRLHIVGIRIPMSVSGDTASERLFRGWLWEQASDWGQHPTIIEGDLNGGPHCARSWQWRSLQSFVEAGWTLITPSEGWSYMSKTGHSSRIDHGLLSAAVTATNARYVTEAGGWSRRGDTTGTVGSRGVGDQC